MGLFSSISKGFSAVVKAAVPIAITAGLAYLTGGASMAFQAAVMTAGLTFASAALAPTPKDDGTSDLQEDTAIRMQLPPQTDNAIPVVYGRPYTRGIITDARISNTNQTMTYVVTMSEKAGPTAKANVHSVLWNDQVLTISPTLGGNGRYNNVTQHNAFGNTTVKTDYANKMQMHSYVSNTATPLVTGHPSAWTIVPGWTQPATYSGSGNVYTGSIMSNLIFTVAVVDYDSAVGLTGLGQIQACISQGESENDSTSFGSTPGDALYDYLTNDRYGAGIPHAEIDVSAILDRPWANSAYVFSDQQIWHSNNMYSVTTAGRLGTSGPSHTSGSATNGTATLLYTGVANSTTIPVSLNSYSLETVDNWAYYANGTPYVESTTPRYQLNGILPTRDTIRNNIERMMLATGSWFSFDPLKGKWTVVMNRAATQTEKDNAFVFDDSNILSEIQLSATDLNQMYNEVEIEFHDNSWRDLKAYQTATLPAAMRNANEYDNTLKVYIEMCPHKGQAQRLAQMYLRQSREDLGIEFTADYSALQVAAGEVVKIANDEYGWDNKLFRIMSVREIEQDDGMLCAKVRCIEYSDDVYTSEPIENFTEATNTNIPIWDVNTTPMPPTIGLVDTMGNVPSFNVQCVFPGSIYDTVELSYSTDGGSNWIVHSTLTNTYDYYKQNDAVFFDFNGYSSGTYVFRVRIAYNSTWSSYSDTSQSFDWSPNSTVYIPGTSLYVTWTVSGTVPDGGPYGQTLEFSIYDSANNNLKLDVVTATTDTGVTANNSYRIVNEGYEQNGWAWSDYIANTSTDVVKFTLANTGQSQDKITSIAPVITYKHKGIRYLSIPIPPGYMFKA